MEIIYKPNNPSSPKLIRIIGVGGAGGNAVDSMIEANLEGVEFIAANTDSQDLNKSLACRKICLGAKTTKGGGAGADPKKGKEAAEESEDEIKEMLADTDMLFIAAGMGGGTGTGAAPVIAKIARDMGILTLAVVSIPFDFEGALRNSNACIGINDIQENVDSLIVIANNQIAKIYGQLLFDDAFQKTDDIITNSAKIVTDIVNTVGKMNIDFADAKRVLLNSGYTMMSIGTAEGDDRVVKATQHALSNPLLSDINLTGCKGLLINIYDGGDLTMKEFTQINEIITNETGLSGKIFVGRTKNESLKGSIEIAIIATGLSPSEAVRSLLREHLPIDPEPKETPRELPPDTGPRSTVDAEWKIVKDRLNNNYSNNFEHITSSNPIPTINNRSTMNTPQNKPTYKIEDDFTSDMPEFLKQYTEQNPKSYSATDIKQGDVPAFLRQFIN